MKKESAFVSRQIVASTALKSQPFGNRSVLNPDGVTNHKALEACGWRRNKLLSDAQSTT